MKRRYRNTAFLVELLINILVFSISCAVLVGLFGKAEEMSHRTKEQGFASAETLRLVEIAKARGAAGLAGGEMQPDGRVLCRYDENWSPVEENQAYEVYLLVNEETTEAGTLVKLEAEAKSAAGETLYTVQTAEYRQKEGGAAA